VKIYPRIRPGRVPEKNTVAYTNQPTRNTVTKP